MNNLKLIHLEERVVLDAAVVAHVIYVNASAPSGGARFSVLGVAPDVNVTLSNNQFLRNSAGLYGGAIASQQEPSVTLTNNLLNQNSAMEGASLHDVSSGTLNILSNVFASNTAAGLGKEIWLDGRQSLVNGQTSASAIINELTLDNLSLKDSEIYVA